jgi:hypothetical protein
MTSIENLIHSYIQSIGFYDMGSFKQTLFIVLLVIASILIIRTFINELKSLRSDLKKNSETKNWPQIDGVITKSIVSVGGFSGDSVFFNEVNYIYNVNGKTYTSDRFSYIKDMGGNGNKKSSEEFQREYPEGSLVHVYYNHDKPSESVLSTENGRLLISYRILISIYGFAIVSVGWIILLWFSEWVACTRSSLIVILYFIVVLAILIGLTKLRRLINKERICT